MPSLLMMDQSSFHRRYCRSVLLVVCIFCTGLLIGTIAEQTVDVTASGDIVHDIDSTTGSSGRSSGMRVVDPQLVLKLKQASGAMDGMNGISEELVVEVALEIQKLKQQPDAKAMWIYLDQQEKMNAPDDQIVSAMAVTIDMIKSTKKLFEELGPYLAFEQMAMEGMVPENMIEIYEKKPEQLEDDTYRGLNLRFLKLAFAGGYLDDI